MVHWKGQHGVYTAWVVCRDIVKASHLTCLDHDDITGRKERKQPWNPAVSSSCGEEIPDCHGNTDPAPPASADAKPVTVQKFMREWKNLKGSPQEQYLWVLVPVSMVPNILGGGMWAESEDISCSVATSTRWRFKLTARRPNHFQGSHPLHCCKTTLTNRNQGSGQLSV